MIKLININKSFGNHNIFKDFNLEIEDYKIYAIVGKSGSGKTTLLNMLGLLDNDYKGKIYLNDTLVTKLSFNKQTKFIRENINYLFQDYALIENENVFYNLNIALAYNKISKKEKQEIIAKALKEVGLIGFENKKIHELSGGEQQRVALARVMIKKGNIILADEPTGNLDKDNGLIVFNILKNLTKNKKTIIIVTHDEEIARLCDCTIKL